MRTESMLPERIGVREVSTLAWPICISMLSFTAMIVADSIFVGWLGTAELAAMGLAGPAVYLIFALGTGVVRGTKVVVSQRTGAGDTSAVHQALWQALWLSLMLGFPVVLLAGVGPSLFGLMGGSEEVVGHATTYFFARAVAAPLTFLVVGLAAWFEGSGDTRTPMKINVLANAVNIALDPLFIFGWGAIPAFGVAGAAWSTVAAQALSVTLYLIAAWRRVDRSVSRSPSRRMMRAIARVGLPMGTRGFLELIAWNVFVSLLARVGEAHLAAHVVVLRIVSVSFLPGYAIGEAGAVLVGQALGARRPELAVQAFRASARLAVTVMLACAVVFVVAPAMLVRPFGVEPAVMELSVTLLSIASLFQLFDAVAMAGQGALNGAGDTRFVMLSSVLVSWVWNLPMAFVVVQGMGMGATGAWFVLTGELVLLSIVTGLRVRSGRWLEVGAAMVEEEELRRAA
jgi:multidrug resistance protein, MATE family